LERLAAPAPKVKTPEVTPEAKPAVDDAKLEALTRSAPSPPAQTKPEPEPPADLAKANEKLSSLLNKPK
jgi:hypothetical protein